MSLPSPGVILAQRYRLTRLLGEGGMGSVWAATHTVTRRQVAIKLPRQAVQPEVRRRFLREATALAAVDHPNVVRVLDAFELDDGTPIIVMDLLTGETLGALLAREEKLPLARAAGLLLPVVSAVGTAHEFGIVHRDLKPDNVFLAQVTGRVEVKVLDFGIAKLDPSATGDGATTTGSMMGTPWYMAPEQTLGERELDQRVDVWAIGVMLYEALSGGRPVEGENLGQMARRFLTDVITPVGAVVPDLPKDVQKLVDGMLARNQHDRFLDLREAWTVLSRHCDVRTPSFGAPRSKVVPSDAPHPVDPVPPPPDPAARSAVTTNAPETLRSSPPALTTVRGRARVTAAAIGVAMATGGVLLVWQKFPRSGAELRAVSNSASGPIETATPATALTATASPPTAESSDAAAEGPLTASAVQAPRLETAKPAPPKKRINDDAARGDASIGAATLARPSEPSFASKPVATAPATAPSSRPSKQGLVEEVPF